MDKSSVTLTEGSDWWLSRTTMGGKERYPKQIRVGDLDRPRVYYPINRDELLTLANICKSVGDMYAAAHPEPANDELGNLLREVAEFEWKTARIIRKALGVDDG